MTKGPTGTSTELAGTLKALGHPARLALLEALQSPSVLSEIELTVDESGQRERPLARQTIKRHLDKLLEEDLVISRSATRNYGETTEYLVDNQRLYALSQLFRSMAALRPEDEPSRETLRHPSDEADVEDAGPALVLVKGVQEGRVFELDPDGDADRWLIGRNRALAVPLDFDPFVSAENTMIRRQDDGFVVEDLPRSRNGTRLNYEPLTSGEPAALSDGDLVSLGETTLLFKD